MLILLSFAACGSPNQPGLDAAVTNCSVRTAQISVGDGFLQRVCGCDEGRGLVVPPNQLDCTVRPGAVVFFNYATTFQAHQIVSRGEPVFPASPLSDPENDNQLPVRAHAITLLESGVYRFEDALNSNLRGALIAQ